MTLPFHVEPLDDEWLAGYLARLTAANDYHHPYEILMEAGVTHLRPEAFAFRDREQLDRLAEYIGLEDQQAFRRMFIPVRPKTGEAQLPGVIINKQHIETAIRRVSPRALRMSAHVRAIWQIRCFSFDPATKEQLLSACPVCGKNLGFQRTLGVEFCDWCEAPDRWGYPGPGVDLREYEQPLVGGADEEGLDFVASLIDPRPVPKAPTISASHPFGLVKRGDIFEFVIALASAVTMTPEEITTIRRPDNLDDAKRITPHLLARAGRAVLDWPAEFEKFCSDAYDQSNRRNGSHGVFKELGAIAVLSRESRLAGQVRQLVKGVIGDAVLLRGSRLAKVGPDDRPREDYVSQQQAAIQYAIGHPTLSKLAKKGELRTYRVLDSHGPKAPVMFLRADIEALVARRGRTDAQGVVSKRLGLAPDVLFELADRGYLEIETGPVSKVGTRIGGHLYVSSSVDRFVDAISARCSSQETAGFEPLAQVMFSFPPDVRPWAETLAAIHAGTVPCCTIGGSYTGFFGGIGVPPAHSGQIPLGKPLHFAVDELLSFGEGGLVLGMAPDTVSHLASAGLLGQPGAKCRVTYGAIQHFASRYITGREAAQRARLRRGAIEPWLAARGVQSLNLVEGKGRRIFDREAVEALLP